MRGEREPFYDRQTDWRREASGSRQGHLIICLSAQQGTFAARCGKGKGAGGVKLALQLQLPQLLADFTCDCEEERGMDGG